MTVPDQFNLSLFIQKTSKDSGWTEGVKERQQENSVYSHLKNTCVKIKSVKMSIDNKNTKISTSKATPKEIL